MSAAQCVVCNARPSHGMGLCIQCGRSYDVSSRAAAGTIYDVIEWAAKRVRHFERRRTRKAKAHSMTAKNLGAPTPPTRVLYVASETAEGRKRTVTTFPRSESDDFDQLTADEWTVWLSAFATSYVAAINSPENDERREARQCAVSDAHMAVDAFRIAMAVKGQNL